MCMGAERPKFKKAGYKVVGVWKGIASGAGARPNARKFLALAHARKADVILVTELTPWGRAVLKVL